MEEFTEYEQEFMKRLTAVSLRYEAPKNWREKDEYRKNVLAPLEKAAEIAVNPYGDHENVAKQLVKDAPKKAFAYANEYLWWLGHLGSTWDKRDNYAREVASRLCSRGILEEPKSTGFTGMGECYLETHPTLRAKIAQVCFLILQAVCSEHYYGEDNWWRVSWY